MSLWSLFQTASQLGAEIRGDGSVMPTALSMDTRILQPGACFVALRVERDGHDFALQAVEKGAAALLVDHALATDCPQLVVPDTLAALQRWGQTRLAAVRSPAASARPAPRSCWRRPWGPGRRRATATTPWACPRPWPRCPRVWRPWCWRWA